MNFDSELPIDVILGRLIAFLIMFQKKIEHLKCKLAGSEDFHTRLAFEKLDGNRTNLLNSSELFKNLQEQEIHELQQNCTFFLRKFSKTGLMTYYEFLKFVAPKRNKILAQRLMIRTEKKNGSLEDYLYKTLLELFQLHIKMCVITQSLRKAIQQNQDLTHMEIVQFFKLKLCSTKNLMAFIRISTAQDEEYDIEQEDFHYLSHYITSGNQLQEWTDTDIMQIISPFDSSLPKYIKKYGHQQFINQKTQAKENDNTANTSLDFLGKTYQKVHSKKDKLIFSPIEENFYDKHYTIDAQKAPQVYPRHYVAEVSHDQAYSRAMYIDNFTKGENSPQLQLNRFLKGPVRREVQVFQDDLKSNVSSVSRQSAFDRS